MTKTALEDVVRYLRRLRAKGYTYDQAIEEMAKPKHSDIDADALGQALVEVYGPYPLQLSPSESKMAQRVAQRWFEKQAQPPKDPPVEAPEKPGPEKKEKLDKEEPKQDSSDEGGADEEEKLQDDLEQREMMQPFSDLALTYAKRLRALKVRGLKMDVNKDEVTHVLRIEANTPSNKDTYLELAPTSDGVQVRSRDFEPDGLLAAGRPYEGDVVTSDQVDTLMEAFYQAWSSRQVG